MKILVICKFGQNRAVFLKKYLQEQGYEAESAGIVNDPDSVQQKIKDADLIVSVQKWIQDQIKESFNVGDKKLICLNVEDDQDHPIYSHASLKEQIDRHLPFA